MQRFYKNAVKGMTEMLLITYTGFQKRCKSKYRQCFKKKQYIYVYIGFLKRCCNLLCKNIIAGVL